jgi:hypothetical protein
MNFQMLKKQILDICFIFLIPGVASLLPYRIAYRWLYHWAKIKKGPLNGRVTEALAVAKQKVPLDDEEKFSARMRLLYLLDCYDLYKSILRSRRSAISAQVEQVGQWPPAGRFIALGFHYGAGHYVLRSLARANISFSFISRRLCREEYTDHPLHYWYNSLRARDIVRLGGRPIAFRPGIVQKLEATLQEGGAVVGMIDLPPQLAPRKRRVVKLLGHELGFPSGLVDLARDHKVPIVPYWIEFDAELYRRRIHIGEPVVPDESDSILTDLAATLDEQIRTSPHAWLLWPELPGWIAEDANLVKASRNDKGFQTL